ncbi:hypothetical protein CEXT_692371 [Caerostris extrusa]|uniref:Uncharacterized protein n=1 Tax=Caerostris extrusa TaxID=172846 RepID=A0AAV4Y011_CAEEX|nr:hypothetical protein CEXT_692371 [Caerostris extrusa]
MNARNTNQARRKRTPVSRLKSMLILLRTSINPVTCRSSLVLSRNNRSRRGIIYQEVHANRDLAVKGTVVASPSQCLASIPVCEVDHVNYASFSMRFGVIIKLRNRSCPEFSPLLSISC